MLNDGVNPVESCVVNVFVQVGNEQPNHIIDWQFPNLAANTNFEGPTLRYILPEVPNATELKIILSCGEYSSEYTLLYDCPIKTEPKEKILNI